MSDNFKLFTSLRYDVDLPQIFKEGWAHAGWNFRNESTLYMLDFHRDRMLRAATHWGWTPAAETLSGDEGIQRLATLVQDYLAQTHKSNCPLMIRVHLTRDGELSCEKVDIPPVPLANLFPTRLPPPGGETAENDPRKVPVSEVVIDNKETARSAYTHYKTTNRAMYDAARDRAALKLPDIKEVLIVSASDGAIMEGSRSTPYFWRNGGWVTPPVSRQYNAAEGSGGNDGTTRRYALERGMAKEEVIKADSLVDGEECWLSNGAQGFRCGRVVLTPKTS